MDKIPIITLLTDFGTKDPYVASVKGVICGINPAAKIIDITHEVKPQDIIEAAFLISCSYKYFPMRTIHVVIVDPTVGSNRRALLVVSDEYFFIAPDNGVLSFIYDTGTVSTVREISAEHYYLPDLSPTFHGRDIFAPVAAWLSKGIECDNFGEPIEDYLKLTLPKPRLTAPKSLKGIVLHIDKFGNLITNIAAQDLLKAQEEYKSASYKIIINQKEITAVKKTYCEGNKGELITLIGSTGYLEIVSYQNSATQIVNAARGNEIMVVFL
jgi:S-adenosyl-L-methionine hydrolase (adenosine-forming)